MKITDNATGLMWEKLSDDGSTHDKEDVYTWYDAFNVKIAALNGGGGFAGYTDWRLPNVKELYSLVYYGPTNPNFVNIAVDPVFNTGCTVTICSCTEPQWYGASTSFHPFVDENELPGAWAVLFQFGLVSNFNKDAGFRVRAVRGGS